MKSKLNSVKVLLTWIARLLAVARFLPFLGKWKEVSITLAALVGGLLALVEKCDSNQPSQQPSQSTPISTPTVPQATPIHTLSPTPSPTPRPPKIIIDRAVVALHPFTVRYTAPFQYNTHLWADKWRLGTMGKDLDGSHILYAVVLNTPGKRRLTIRDKDNTVLAEHIVEVHNETGSRN
jgi:hypothetical protein